MITFRRKLGNKAEAEAVKYLQSMGYKIIGQNYTKRIGEIDIIARENEEFVFVEVKSLSNENKLSLTETISVKKRNSLVKVCQVWLSENQLSGLTWRIDFIGILMYKGEVSKLQHLKAAIY